MIRALSATFLLLAAPSALAQTTWPHQREGDFIIKDFRFASGETLPELKLHYTTLGTAKRNAAGEIVNGVLLLHGTGGVGANWLLPSLANELFGEGQPLDAARHFSSSCPTASGAAARPSQATACARNFRITAIATSSRRNTG